MTAMYKDVSEMTRAQQGAVETSRGICLADGA